MLNYRIDNEQQICTLFLEPFLTKEGEPCKLGAKLKYGNLSSADKPFHIRRWVNQVHWHLCQHVQKEHPHVKPPAPLSELELEELLKVIL